MESAFQINHVHGLYLFQLKPRIGHEEYGNKSRILTMLHKSRNVIASAVHKNAKSYFRINWCPTVLSTFGPKAPYVHNKCYQFTCGVW